MMNRNTLFTLLVGLALMLTVGCSHALTQYTWVDASSATSTMKRRDSKIKTISSTFSLWLQSGEGQIELKGAFVAQPPDQLRLRAWKLARTVLDITLNNDGLFVYTANRKQSQPPSANKLTHDRLMEAVAFLPGFNDITSWETGSSDNQNIFSLNQAIGQDNAKMICHVDKHTLTTKTCTYLDEQGLVRQTLTFEAYQDFNNIAWPMILSGHGDSGNFEIHFSRVTINEELSKRAFVPSRRATKQP